MYSLPKLDLGRHDLGRVGQHLGGEFLEGIADMKRIDRLGRLRLILFGEFLQQLLAAHGDVLKGGLHFFRVGGGGLV